MSLPSFDIIDFVFAPSTIVNINLFLFSILVNN